MTRHPLRALLLWLLAMLTGAAVVWQSRFTADMSFFLPARPTAEQQVLVDQLKESVVSRLLMLAIGGGDETQRAALSRELRARLAADPAYVAVQNGEAAGLDAARDLLFSRRYLLSPAVTPERFTEAGLRDAIAGSIDLLASPAGMLLKPYLTRDPTGELFELLGKLDGGSQPASRAGVWASRDGERAMLLVQTRALGSETDAQEAAIAGIENAFAAARAAVGEPPCTLQLSGPGRFAVNARATIRDEVTRLSLLSTLCIALVLFVVYRSPRLVVCGLLPVASGALAGVVAVALVYGTVFGVTVGFGSALIGEAVDYSIYYFVQSGRLGVAGWRERFWPTIRLGVATSAAGFGALLFSGFPGLAQLGLYALAGVLAAALTTRLLLPQLAEGLHDAPHLSRASQHLAAWIARLRLLRWPLLLLAAGALLYLAAVRDRLWQPDLSALSTVSAAEATLDGQLRNDLGAPDSRYLVVIRAADLESALQAAERAGRQLDPLVAAQRIGGYDNPARFLPSQASQAARRASLPEPATLQAALARAQAGSPLAASRLQPFREAVEAARQAPLLQRADLAGSSLALAVDALLLARPDGWNVLLPLRPQPGSDLPVAEVRAALAGSGALFIDLKGEFDALYASYLDEAVRLSSAGFGAIVLLLAITLRSPRRVGGVLLPLLLAVVLVIAGLHLLGERLHLLHLVGMLLIVAVGSNYALFFDELAHDGVDAEGTLASLAVANLTTAIGFGTLGLSSVPVLHAVGVTVGPGAVLALVLSAIFLARRRPA